MHTWSLRVRMQLEILTAPVSSVDPRIGPPDLGPDSDLGSSLAECGFVVQFCRCHDLRSKSGKLPTKTYWVYASGFRV